MLVMKNSTIFATTKPITYMTNTQSDTYNTLITRELLPPPITSCRINNKSLRSATPALLHTVSCRMSRALFCLCLMLSTLIFASCESYEYPQNEVLKGYFEESKGLFQASTDSISRFSAKVNEFTTRIPEAKNDPLYGTRILSRNTKKTKIFFKKTQKKSNMYRVMVQHRPNFAS